ncbi:hypothetical protein F2Q65_14820 [Thiohalocapsa marina]|uniref:Uncharacterized protein n=1 Tax=Thiohalocapsa marina TaxID=424902 RepID=A0A5M8FIB3_9GAMM|nr:hypothetical protein [Thiohalocapsa marina]KAA6183710.1 hypothetical protein F2Q65_14820 [Thiohalocapsa marina]
MACDPAAVWARREARAMARTLKRRARRMRSRGTRSDPAGTHLDLIRAQRLERIALRLERAAR